MDTLKKLVSKDHTFICFRNNYRSEENFKHKLAAAVALTGAHKAADIAAVSAELDDFVFVPYAVNEEDIGSYFVNNFAEYGLHEDMEEFFDFEAFGKHIIEKYDGRFVDGGFVCCTRPYSLEKLLERIDVEDAEDEGMNKQAG